MKVTTLAHTHTSIAPKLFSFIEVTRNEAKQFACHFFSLGQNSLCRTILMRSASHQWAGINSCILTRRPCHAKQFLPSNSNRSEESEKYIITLSNAVSFGQRFQWRRTTKNIYLFFRSLEKSLFNLLASRTNTHAHHHMHTRTNTHTPNVHRLTIS